MIVCPGLLLGASSERISYRIVSIGPCALTFAATLISSYLLLVPLNLYPFSGLSILFNCYVLSEIFPVFYK